MVTVSEVAVDSVWDPLMTEPLSSLLAAAPLPQILVGANARVAAANAGTTALFGSSLQGRHYVTVLRQPAVLDCVEAILAGGAPATAVLHLTSGSRRDTTWRVSVGPVRLPDGLGALVSFEDTTAESEASQIRRDFVANVSHELRTPLTALLGFIETLRGAARRDVAAQERFLEIMAREAERMNRLVDGLLSLNRVESEERMRPTAQVDLAATVQSVALSLRPLADEAGVSLMVCADVDPALVHGDEDQLAQVLNNLVENAIKYGGSGGEVHLTVSRVAREAALRAAAIRVDVTDQGEGFDQVHIPRLTERFYRVDTHRSRELGGTGLGLAIVKHIVSRHRGRLRITSEKGKGSTFSVILPASDSA